jgi:hypothetical protein
MPVSPEVLDQVRAALAEAPTVEDARIDVRPEGDAVVLAGAVPTPEQAEVAAMIAARHADSVANRLLVDAHLREDPTVPDVGGAADRRRPPRGGQLTVQSSSGEPEPLGTDLHQDADAALAENTPLDPPDAPHMAPSAGEQRGVLSRDSDAEEFAEPGDEPADGAKSLADVPQQELEHRARRGRDRAS